MANMKTVSDRSMRRMKNKNLTIGKRNTIIANIYRLIDSSQSFLLVGHLMPDEDCYASLTASALLLSKFHKKIRVFFSEPFPKPLSFLEAICQYNRIPVYYGTMPKMDKPDVLCILDTPKPALIAADAYIHRFLADDSIPKIELDHHFASDAQFCGDDPYSLVFYASSTCEILCILCYKLLKHPEVFKRYRIYELFSRNVALTLLTGMLGDARLGDFLHKKRDKKVFDYFSNYLNQILKKKTILSHNSKNIDSIEVLFDLLKSSTEEDKQLYSMIIQHAVFTGKIGKVLLTEADSAMLISMTELSQLVTIIKTVTNDLADEKDGVGISSFYDYTADPVQVQCRIRGSGAVKGINLHKVIEHFNIEEGGGHPGAIAFRVRPKSYYEFSSFIDEVENFINTELLP